MQPPHPPAYYHKERLEPDVPEDKTIGNLPEVPDLGDLNGDGVADEDEVWSMWVEFTLLVPATYSRIDLQKNDADVSPRGDSVFLQVQEDDPRYLDDVVDADRTNTADTGFERYETDTNDVNHHSDHGDEEMIVGQPDNGNGGIVFFPPGGGGTDNHPVVWVPGAGTTWTRYPPGCGTPCTATGTATDWSPSEAERQLFKETLKDTMRDPAGTNDPAGSLAQYMDPSKVNKVVKVTLTRPPTTAPDPDDDTKGEPQAGTHPHTLATLFLDESDYNDAVEEMIVCTSEGAFLIRSKTDSSGVTTYDPPVLLSENADDVRDATTADVVSNALKPHTQHA